MTTPAFQAIVSPLDAMPRTISYSGAKLVIGKKAVSLPVGIGITPLAQTEVPKLDPGMTNVTAGKLKGYRFTPHPFSFDDMVQVSLPYDPALLGDGFTAQDVYTFFYDEQGLCWRPLDRVNVDEVNHVVTSLTDHFTDMINSTLMVPEHPEGASFNPNQIKDIQTADPGANVNLIAPPAANNQGDNRLSYPIEVPPGRLGLQPQLSVAYNSSGGDGWLGVGWDLSTPAVTLDTRWGAPRFEAGLETETYQLDGEQLTPVAHRGPAQPRTAEKVFHTRVEGQFAKIIRHGDNPTNYSWEIVDKEGAHWLYGGAPDTTLADRDGRIAHWALREMRDAHGNVMRYEYATVNDSGIDGGSEPGRNLYPRRITYTGFGGSGGRYAVTFTRDRDLGEPLRADKQINARYGFKKVTADLLRKVEVTLDGSPIRRYELAYTTGAFAKTLLKSITQFGEDGAAFNTHTFDYFDDIRDAQGGYQAFSPTGWTTPGDNLSKGALNLTPERAGDASALNATTSAGGGGHLYVGVGTSATSKSNSVGVKVGFNHTDDEGLLALIDVDGDSLPDKVFKKAGSVQYRKNLSRPGGQTKFSDDTKPLGLPGINGENSNSLTLGIEGYLGAVAAQLDYVNTFTTTDQYFSDVNGDGISDLVNGGSVLFGRVGPDGVPVYGISGDTPVPVGSGTVNGDGLFGNFAQDRDRMIDSFPLLDSVRRWVAPYDGTVRVEGAVRLADDTAAARATSRVADGVRVAIQKEDSELWSDTVGPRDNTAHSPSNVDSIPVTRGQRLYFRVGSGFDGGLDQVSWDPRVSYLNVGDPVDVNGLAFYRYQASRDFTLGGRSAQVKLPLTGTLHLSGDLTKSRATSDDVSVVITRDGTPVVEQSLAGNATGSIPVNLDIPVQQGQILNWRVRVDSPIDVDAISWTPEAHYTAADGVARVTDNDGKFLITIFPPYDLDIYPLDGLAAPQGFFHVDDDATLTVEPALAFNFGSEQPNARVAFTVKRRGELVAKRFFDIHNGQLTSPGSFDIDARAGDDLFFDFSTLDPKLRNFLTSQSVQVNGSNVPSALHSAAEEGAFPQPYRGWAAIGYNGNRDRATQPITQADLVVDEHFGDQLPSSVDPQAQKDAFAADPRVNPPKVAPFSPSPQQNRWGAGEHNWVARASVSSSRLGVDSIALPNPGDFADATAVPRLSRSDQISLTGSVGGSVGSVGGSIATGTSTGQVDFMDMNGDQFPDVVGAGGIQYSEMTGGLGGKRSSTPDGAVRKSTNVSGNANAGSAARTIATGRGYASPPATASANTSESGNDMPPLGAPVSVGGSLGAGSSDGQFDLLDLNGDELPDRVYTDGHVALNLGYRFGDPEPWRNPAPLNDGSSFNVGLNIGFNTDFYSLAGGASYSEGTNSTSSTLMDMNGDGLMDRVFAGTPIKVGLNTGNGFLPPVDFNGSLGNINGDQNAKLGGGVYFTFGICFTVVCIVINPGGDLSTGANRTEQALRDINGDGYADQLLSTRDDQLSVVQNRTGRTNLLRGVSRPLGGRMDFDYQRDGNTYDQPQSRWVLSRTSVHDGHPGDGQDVKVSTFEYSGGVFDRLEREFYGYGSVVERDRDAGNSDAVYRSTTREYRTDSHYTRGLLRHSLSTDAAGKPFLETENTYQLRDVFAPGAAVDPKSTTGTIFPAATRTDRRFFEGQPAPGKSTHTEMDYDGFGNLTRSFDAADTGPGDDVDARVRYTAEDPACRASGIVGAPTVIDVFGAGALMRHRESTVDCSTGDTTELRARLETGAVAVTNLEHFGNGNLKAVIGPPNEHGQRYRLDYGYDTVVDTHIESITDSFGYRSTTTHNLKYGQVTTTTDLNNQVITNTYDTVGRLDTVTGPYEAPENRITIDFEYHPEAGTPYAVTRHADRDSTGAPRSDTIDTITFIDGLKRTIQTKKDATVSTGPNSPPSNVMVVSGHTTFDFVGRPVELSYPVTEPKAAANTTFNPAVDPVPPTRTSFDILDRSVRTVLPDNTQTAVAYGFGPDRSGTTQFEQVATDANGKQKRTYSDVREETTSVKEFNAAGGQPVIWTSYAYDPMRQLVAVTDDHGNVTGAAYDNFGRRTIVDSPDSGRTQTAYDLADNPIRKITAKLAASGQSIVYDFDFNRVAAIRYPIFHGNDVTYTYGAPGAANNGANRVVAMHDGAGDVSREYGPLGELTAESRTVAAQGSHVSTFTTRYAYDTWNRVLRMTFPDGEVLSYNYNSGGDVDAATGVKGSFTYPYLRRLDYDKFGQKVLLDTGNGTRTEYTYTAADRRLDTLRSTLSGGYTFQNLNYDYDNVGNVTALRNETVVPPGPEVGQQVGGPSTQTFRYDDLYQLTHAEGSYQSRNPRTDVYAVDFAYDSIHNLSSKNQVHQLVSNGNAIVDGKTTYNFGYTYRAAQPHAPSALGPYTLQYDQNGNQISRSQQPQPRRQLIWDEENRLACTHENVQSMTLPQTPEGCDNPGGTPNRTRDLYDDKGNRVVKDGAQFNIYPNRSYSTRGNQEFKHVYIGSTKLITKFVEPDNRIEDRQYYSHADQLGSTGFVTDDHGQLSEHLQYFPGGETWVSEHPSQPVQHQFTGKEFDQENGLYYYGARYYEPRTQQWQSPDPVIGSYLDGAPNGGVFSSANLASYTYAANNPVRLNDPDGKWLNVAIGAGVGLLVGVGVEGVRQAIKGEFNAGRLVGAAGAGVISGAVAGATMGASLLVQGSAAVGAGVVGGVVARAAAGEPQTTEAVVTDAVISGVTFGVVKGGGSIVRAVRGTPPAAVSPAAQTATQTAAKTATAEADIAAANFAQKTASRMFSAGGKFAGQTIDDVAASLRSGALTPKDVPIDVIVREGKTLILNTRSAQALMAANVPRSAWNVVNRTGIAEFEERLTGQLTRNGLDSSGIATVRITGGGQ